MAIYAIDNESHLGHYYFKSLIEMLNEVLENAEEEKDEDDIDAVITVTYEYDDDSLELLEYLENSDFFSRFYHKNPMECRKFRGIYSLFAIYFQIFFL